MKKQFWIGSFITLIVSAIGFAQPATNSTLGTNSANPYLDNFVFLPGGFRPMAAAMSATNETFRLALRYIGEVQAGHRPPKLPDGVSVTDISNVNYTITIWSWKTPSRPINFYGKVVDENGEPVVGASVHFDWDGSATNTDAMERNLVPEMKNHADLMSDSAGLFSLTNKAGIELRISVGKDGYYSSRRNREADLFKYSQLNLDYFYGRSNYFRADSSHPVVYYLRKMGVGANSLMTSQFGIREDFDVMVPRDGTPVDVDLLNRKAGNGSLEIRQTKPDYPAHGGIVENLSPSDYAKLISATNWSFTMKMNGGGFLEESEEFPFSPPESGYQSVVTFNFQKGQTNWTTQLKKDFYIKFGNPPLYGQLQVETSSYQSTVILTYVINPDGSRNLEPKQNYFPSSSTWRH